MTQHTAHTEHVVDSVKTYGIVFAALIVATVATTMVAYIDLGVLNPIVALAIAVCKACLVAFFFMHVRHGTRLTKLVLSGGLVWLGILLMFGLTDFATRGWI